mmetsp:Transcript_8548/g.24163  ORF Transcript_8548/g.24163 Transcript_8548/m.24163 type:complete len:204 (-) Transcript_8548:12-623(-)
METLAPRHEHLVDPVPAQLHGLQDAAQQHLANADGDLRVQQGAEPRGVDGESVRAHQAAQLREVAAVLHRAPGCLQGRQRQGRPRQRARRPGQLPRAALGAGILPLDALAGSVDGEMKVPHNDRLPRDILGTARQPVLWGGQHPALAVLRQSLQQPLRGQRLAGHPAAAYMRHHLALRRRRRPPPARGRAPSDRGRRQGRRRR